MTEDKIFPVRNPSTGEIVDHAPNATIADLDRAVARAKSAFGSWSKKSDTELKEACEAIAAAIGEHAEELAKLITLEQGKPLNGLGSRWEIGGAQAWQAIPPAFVARKGAARQQRRPRGDASQTGWHRRVHHAVELPGHDRDLAHHPCPAYREHGCRETVTQHAVVHHSPGRDHEHGPARRGGERHHQRRQAGEYRCSHVGTRGHRQDRLHRLLCDGSAGDGIGRRDHETPDARTGRQRCPASCCPTRTPRPSPRGCSGAHSSTTDRPVPR